MQLGFSEPLEDPSDIEIIGHRSPRWEEWDGGKIGGVPSWLDPREIPKIAPLRCVCCAKRFAANGEEGKKGTLLRFLTQIYSPADKATGNENAFHRSLYVFCCPHRECALSENAHDSVVVLRSQLPQDNEFYPPECDVEGVWEKHKSASWDVNLCAVCGQRATGRCPISKQHFCSKDHQKVYHKAMKKAKESGELDLSKYVYKESELVVEEEPAETKVAGSNNVEEMNQSSIFADGEDKSDEMLEQKDLNEMTGNAAGTDDPTTLEFYTRIGVAGGDVKGQCLRYCRWEDNDISASLGSEQTKGPLWISSDYQPAKNDIPPCEDCGAPRKFEFQIMPQIANFIKKTPTPSNDVLVKKEDWEDEENPFPELSESGKKKLLDFCDKPGGGIEVEYEGPIDTLPEHMKNPATFEALRDQILSKMKTALVKSMKSDDTLDFGTIAIYSCTASCGRNDSNDGFLGSYQREFAWRQKPL
jgi:pre-rRNA-processing protein TSR4